MLRRAGHQGQIRFRGFNQEMHYGQVLGVAERRRARVLRLAPCAAPGPRPRSARAMGTTCWLTAIR